MALWQPGSHDVLAAKILGHVGNIAPSSSADHLASYTAPPRSKRGGDVIRHRRCCRSTERITRYSILVIMPNGYAADDIVAGLVEGLGRIPAHLLRSITFDQGSEWANWTTIADTNGIDCQPAGTSDQANPSLAN